ncbi:mechanosensitive ion channel family protein [Sphingobacterium corticibacterium]|uniref:Mechanosensitive ion channel n=1 Tax=Sphingobacterium corticibacterium TaxID=2484746 RepID=A0A4Q6XEW2_9SPHI|nr:mechanosensitive ion channel domain-containing protein [Sphingobacterium corticibacterium]RZF58390.1 mechanosensitive ion channel [Sphingobacterium corticibacterium]
MMTIEKNRKLQQWLLRLFVLLLYSIIHPGVQSQDSLFYSQQFVWKERQAQVHQWKQVQDTLSTTVDSIKKSLLFERKTPDSTALDSTLVFLGATKKGISQYIYDIKNARTIWSSTPAQIQVEADSLLEVDSLVTGLLGTDSLEKGAKDLIDTLPQLIRGYERLIGDVVYLERLIGRQQAEIGIVNVDSAAAEMNPVRRHMVRAVQTNLGKDGSSSEFFDYPAWSSRLFLILVSFLYFYWMYKLGRKTEGGEEEFRLYQNQPLWIPFLKASIFFLVLLPFASFSVPVLILESSYFFVFVFLYIILYQELSIFKRKVLGLIFVSYIILISANLFLSALWWTKALAILANVISITLVWFMGRRTDVDNPIGYIHRYARWLIIMGHFLAIVLNLMGYISFARMWSLATGIGLLQVIALRAVREMLLHDIEHQYKKAKPEALFRRFDLKRMLLSFERLFRFCSAVLIVLVLLNNFHLVREASALLERLFMTEHKIGGITFAYANLLLAVVVIWLANWFQKNLKNLLDDTSPTDELQVRRMTLFPLFRLLIIVIGFLIGISILGLGMDKLTVIIGALSVGIGLGLQNIINNFVSGIILVFEKPFKIGDYVELADKKGQVREIGIRSSTLLTDEGARVIIPNGDLLSGRLVNWTFRDADIRVNFKLTIENSATPIEEIRKELKIKLASFEEIDRSIPMKIFTKEITADNYQLSIQVGIKHVRYIERFRSRFLESFKKDMDARGVKVSSS